MSTVRNPRRRIKDLNPTLTEPVWKCDTSQNPRLRRGETGVVGRGGAADPHGHTECSGVNSSRPTVGRSRGINSPATARPGLGRAVKTAKPRGRPRERSSLVMTRRLRRLEPLVPAVLHVGSDDGYPTYYVARFGGEAEDDYARMHGSEVEEEKSEPIGPVKCPAVVRRRPATDRLASGVSSPRSRWSGGPQRGRA